MAVDITPNKDGGVLKEILTPGEGTETPPKGSAVNAHYHGTLTDGTVFDSSVERGQPFQFALGKGSVIKAWDLGVATMKKGEKARLTCKAEYAYGERGSPPKIPGGATLIFDIELLSWQEEDLSKAKNGGILRSIIEDGRGIASPAQFRECKVHIKGSHDGRIFEDRDLSFTLGEGEQAGLPRGLERAIEKMTQGEKSRITLSPQYGWPNGKPEHNIPPGATLKYEVFLEMFEKDKEAWDMDAAEKLKEAEMFKTRATDFFKAEKFKIAARMYNKGADYLKNDPGFSETEEVERKKLLLAIRLNLGLVHLKLKDYTDARNECDKALELDPDNVKGLFRRGQALFAMNEPELARVDFERVVKLEPNNNAAKAQITACARKIKEARDKEKQIYSNMFDKLAKKDQEGHCRFGWWDEENKKPIITELIPEDKEDLEERRREKRKQLEHLKKIAERRRKEKEEEAERLAKGESVDQEKGSEVPDQGNKEDVSEVPAEDNKESAVKEDTTEAPVDGTEESAVKENSSEAAVVENSAGPAVVKENGVNSVEGDPSTGKLNQ